MALINCVKLSDALAIAYAVDVGVVVVPKSSAVRLSSPAIVDFAPFHYGFAIVVSMAPFVLVSEQGDMRWETTVKPIDFHAVGIARDDVMAIANTRLAS